MLGLGSRVKDLGSRVQGLGWVKEPYGGFSEIGLTWTLRNCLFRVP